MLELVEHIVTFMELGGLVYLIVLARRKRPLTTTAKDPPTSTEVDNAMRELLDKSRASGGRVHIHDVEEVVRRRLG